MDQNCWLSGKDSVSQGILQIFTVNVKRNYSVKYCKKQEKFAKTRFGLTSKVASKLA